MKSSMGPEPQNLAPQNLAPQDLAPLLVTDREARALAEIDRHEIDALIVTSPTNIRWLTGFSGSNATVVVYDADITLFTDSRYADRAPVELGAAASSAEIVIARATLGDEIQELLGRAELVGLEAEHVSWAQQRRIGEEWLPEQTIVPTIALVDQLRSQKDDGEIARIRAAAEIVDAALTVVRPLLAQQPTERDFARALDASIRSGGADDLGFDTIVASGPNGAIPHHAPGNRTIERGDLVIVDVGAMVHGYRSDMTRTFCVGPMSPEQRHHYDTVLAAQQAGVDAMVAGAGTAQVDAAARTVIADAGWADSFTHGTGHGVGLDIHELPRVAKDVPDVYELGTVATVEPGVYLKGSAGVRIEDTCVVTTSGAERLTGFPKDPEVL